MAFDKDQNRVSIGCAGQNLKLVHRIALSLLKQGRTKEIEVRGKRRNAGRDDTDCQAS